MQNEKIVSDVINAISNELMTFKDKDFDNFNVEIPIVRKDMDFVIVVWGKSQYETICWYSISVRPLGNQDDPGDLEGFFTNGMHPETIRDAVEKAIEALDRYIDTGLTPKKPSQKKYRRGGHIRSLDELSRQKFVYWHDKITHNGWFMSWQLRMAANAIGDNGCIYYAIEEEKT